jgi:D-arabinose 1-dehydrogenase-like Zn-dependent alcohol dehydrogenase
MKEAIVSPGPKVKIVDSAVPEPGPEQVVIKVVVSGSNPKDWYVVLSIRLSFGSTSLVVSHAIIFYNVFHYPIAHHLLLASQVPS